MPKNAKTHEDWLLLICGVCTRKVKDLRNITEQILKLIHDHHYEKYNFSWCPSKICKGQSWKRDFQEITYFRSNCRE